jgi:hypothetical protein
MTKKKTTTNDEKYHTYQTEETKSDYNNPRVGKGSKTDTYKRWKQDGVLNDKLLLIEGYARDGAKESDIAVALGISPNTLINMKNNYREVSEALRKGKEIVDYAVENALLRKALSGDVQAMIFWLKNRKPSQWRDLKELNASLQDGFVNIDLTGIISKVGNKGKLKNIKTEDLTKVTEEIIEE